MNAELHMLSRLDRAFAAFLVARTHLDKNQRKQFEEIVSFLSSQQNHGHSCIALDIKQQQLMQASGLVSEQGRTPLILEQGRLYLHRYWFYETRLAQRLGLMVQQKQLVTALPEAVLARYFASEHEDIDWQREAAKTAVKHVFSIITGGPGTGKTTTVVKILAILQEINPQPLHIALAAPTGKAAKRLQESIANSKTSLPCTEALKASIPESVHTIHRLLGTIPASPYFQHHRQKPLAFDLVVIDEASMVDLALMSKLLDALADHSRLILLGDKDQLSSVESGAVLADLTSALPENTLELKKAYRFNENIKALAQAVNEQQADSAWQLLHQGQADISLLKADLISFICAQLSAYLELINNNAAMQDIFLAFSAFQVLCANRQGKNSVTDINLQVEQHLAAAQKIHLSGVWYSGRPIMITQNNASMHLYNGDIGICLPDAEQHGKLMVFFAAPGGGFKKFLPARLLHYETVYAMTIHKSQGSEFARVLIVLPEHINPVLTRELLYTAITRARSEVLIMANRSIFEQTVQQQVERFGGLAEKLKTQKPHFFKNAIKKIKNHS